MNIQHSSRSDRWFTPIHIIEMVKKVIGPIDFDPASENMANSIVEANQYYSEDSLDRPWLPGSIYLNPPGGKTGNQSNTVLFWQKLMKHKSECDGFEQAVFMAFSLEAASTTQKQGYLSILDFPCCVPSKRIKFVYPLATKMAPSHANIIVYVPGLYDRSYRFKEVFSSLGKVIQC